MQDRYLRCPPTFSLAPQLPPPTFFILESPLLMKAVNFHHCNIMWQQLWLSFATAATVICNCCDCHLQLLRLSRIATEGFFAMRHLSKTICQEWGQQVSSGTWVVDVVYVQVSSTKAARTASSHVHPKRPLKSFWYLEEIVLILHFEGK